MDGCRFGITVLLSLGHLSLVKMYADTQGHTHSKQQTMPGHMVIFIVNSALSLLTGHNKGRKSLDKRLNVVKIENLFAFMPNFMFTTLMPNARVIIC